MDDDNHNIQNLKIYSNIDELLRELGTILSTPKSRRIYAMLIDKEMHAREIAKIIENKQNPHLPGIKFHLIKMVKADIVQVKIKLQRKNGKLLKYYRATPFILIVPPHCIEKIKNNKTLYSLLKDIYKDTSIVFGFTLFLLSHMSFFWRRIPYIKTQNSLMKQILLGHFGV